MKRQTDYPELENKKVIVLNNCKSESKKYDVTTRCFSVNCNYHIGITIVSELNPKEEWVCLNRKDLFLSDLMTEVLYAELFDYCIQGIKNGVVNGSKLNHMLPWFEFNQGMAECAFKQ